MLEEIGMADRSDEISSGWDGLTGSYRKLWESQRDQSGNRFDDGFQRRWARLINPGPLVPLYSPTDSKADTHTGSVTAFGGQVGRRTMAFPADYWDPVQAAIRRCRSWNRAFRW